MNFTRSKSGRLIVPEHEGVRGYRSDELIIEFWGGECGLMLRALPRSRERIEIYPSNRYRAERGGMEYGRLLLERPPSLALAYDFDSWGLNFFHQPALTVAELQQGCQRPEHIVNSYAVYHKTKGGFVESSGPDYKNGKACHIYRSWAEDARGRRVWCNLQMKPGRIIQVLPKWFWREASYPVYVDPTFGYTTQGGSSAGFANTIVGNDINAPEDGTGVSLTGWLGGTSTVLQVKGNIYTGNDAFTNGETEERIVNPVDTGEELTYSFNSAPSFSNGVAYRLCLWAASTSGSELVYHDAQTSQPALDGQTYGAWPNPASFSNGTQRWSIYATYTAAGGAGPCMLPLLGVGKCAAPLAGLEWLRHRKNRIRYCDLKRDRVA